MVYFLKFCMSIAVRIYFRRISVVGLDKLPKDKPILITPNHPSGFMDPILLAVTLNRPVHFIARGESFLRKWKVWVFRRMRMLPIYRPDKTRQLVHKNKEVFESCFQILERNGAIIIFPEGLSKTEPRLRKIKTGAARIALGAEQRNAYELGVHVVPVGLNYANPHKFRNDVEVVIGNPIRVNDHVEEGLTRQQIARSVTDQLRQDLSTRCTHVEQPDMAEHHEALSTVFAHQVPGQNGLPVLQGTIMERERKIAVMLNAMNDERTADLETSIVLFKRLSNVAELAPAESYLPRRKTIWDMITWPLAMAGHVVHYVPFKITGWMTDALIKRADFRGSFLLVLGFWIFALYLVGQSIILSAITGSALLGLLSFPASVGLGLFALHYRETAKAQRAYRQYQRLLRKSPNLMNALIKMQIDILQILQDTRRKAA